MVKGGCSNFSPAIIDTDGALRWVGTAGHSSFVTTFFDNAVYLAAGTKLYRIELDGAVTLIGDYSDRGISFFHHVNWIDIQKNALSPPNALESAIVLHLPSGSYTAIVRGANGATGNALVEVYVLD